MAAADKLHLTTGRMFSAMLLDTKMNGAHRFLSKKQRAKFKSLRHPLSPSRSFSKDSVDGLERGFLTMDPSGAGKRSGSYAPTAASSAGASRSVSLASVSSDGSTESHLVEQEDIVVLTQEVRTFKEALGRLRRLIHPDKDKSENSRSAAHDRLGEVLRILRVILERYPALQSTELLVAAGSLIHQVKEFNYEDDKCDAKEFMECIDQLALAFSSRVSEYLMGDLDSNVSLASSISSKTKSCENLPSDVEGGAADFREGKEAEALSGSHVDSILVQLEQGVEVALHRAKLWSKYAKDIIGYVEKRCHLEMEFAKNVTKLAQTMRSTLKEESYLPFQSIYITAMDQEVDNNTSTQMTNSLLLGPKFVEPLTARRNEHERHRKQIKETWQRELKRMQEAVSNLRKARALYIQRQQEWERAKEAAVESADPSKVEKRKRVEDDALHKAVEAETTYKECVAEANERHSQLLRTKNQVLQQVRELMLQCDQTMKAVTVSYFQLQNTVSAPIPVQFQTLCESSRLYEPGSQYMEFVKRIPVPNRTGRYTATASGPFAFEPYSEEAATATSVILDKERKSNGSISTESSSTNTGSDRPSSAPQMVPLKAWGSPTSVASSATHASSDTESVESSPSTKSRDNSPTASPMMPARRLVPASSGDELENDQENDGGYVSYGASRRQCLSKAAVTHTFRKLKTPSRCRECDSYVYFQGAECVECGLACHKKCLETLAIQCGHKRLPRKMTTFGVDLSQHLAETGACVPHLVAKCISEIDSRGIQIKGLYRVSGVKSKVEKLCQAFENGADLVDLTDVHPNVIANVLKLYLRQLPEPLLTSRLYPEFIRIAKDSSSTTIDDLRELCRKLPRNHYVTLAVLMHHLKRVSDESSLNNMPSSNLGIVFGPTLLRTSEGSASLSSLVDTVHQTKVIELLITHAEEIFGPVDVYSFVRENSARAVTKQEDMSLLSKVPVMRSLSFLEKHRRSRDSEVIVSTPADRRSEIHEEVTLPGFVAEPKSSSRSSEHDGGLSTDEGGFNPTSDEDLPDFLLPDDSGKPGKLPHFRKEPAPKVFRGSLKDYHGLEGVNLNLLAAQEIETQSTTRSRKTETCTVTTSQQSHSLLSSASTASSEHSSLASVQGQGQGQLKTPFMDSSIDSDHSWESQSTGSSGRGTQQSDQGSLHSGPRSSRMSNIEHDEVDGPPGPQEPLSSVHKSLDENRVKIQVPSAASLPPHLQSDDGPLASILNISRTSTSSVSESRGLVTVLEGPTNGTTLVESLAPLTPEQTKSLVVGSGNSSSTNTSASSSSSSLRSSSTVTAASSSSSSTTSAGGTTNISRTVLVSDLASLPAGLNHDFAHVFRSVRSVTTTTTTLDSSSSGKKNSDRTPRFV